MSSSKKGEVGKGVVEKLKSVGTPAAVDAQSRTKVILNPDRASCEGNSEICLIFDDEMRPAAAALIGVQSGGRVEVCVQTMQKCDRILATKVNERTFFFLAPNNREGDASVVVFVNGTEVASSYLRYRSSDTVHLVAGLSQIYLQFLSTVCRYMYALQTKHQIPSPMPELDRLLAESFEDKDNKHNIPPKAFEELFDILRHSSADVVQSEHELPSLLHLSGAYGLNQLTERLLDLPGARMASDIFNRDGRTGSELAFNNGYPQLAKTFSASKKVNSDPVDARNPSNILKGGSKGEDGDYMLLSNATSSTDFDNDRRIFPQHQQSTKTVTSGTSQKPPPPAPCQKFVEYKILTGRIPDSQLPTLPPRSSVGTVAPPDPRRDSSDSGVNIDGIDAPGLLTTPTRKRPPLLRGLTEPAFVLSNEEEGHSVSRRRSSQDTTAGKTVQRNLNVSGEEIARQLKKPVHSLSGTKGSSVKK